MRTLAYFGTLLVITLVTAAIVAAAPRPNESITVDGARYKLVRSGVKVVVLPEVLSAALDRVTASPAPNCAKYDSDMRRLERLLNACKSGPTHSESACTLGKQGADALRAPDFTPDVSQKWKLTPSPQDADVSASRVSQAVQAQTGLSAARVIVILHPTAFASGATVTVATETDSWVGKLDEAGLGRGDAEYDSYQDAVSTTGRDVACDLLASRASLVVEGDALLSLNTAHLLDGKTAWSIRSTLSGLSLPQQASPLVRAALTGAHLAMALQDAGKVDAQDFDEVISDLFSLLFDDQSFELKPVESFESFEREHFRQMTRVRVKITTETKQ